MAVLQLLEKIRSLNVHALRKAVEDNLPCHVEAVLRDDAGEIVVEGPFDLPCRVDVVLIDEEGALGRSIMVDPPTRLDFSELALDWKGLAVGLRPFGWDYAGIACAFTGPPDWTPLLDWFWQRFDPEDRNEETDEGLFDVLHYLSDPVFENGNASFVVDLGSAPVDAFIALIDTLRAMGATRVDVG